MALDYLLGKYQKGSAYATLFFSAVASLFVPSNAIAQEAYQQFRNPRPAAHETLSQRNARNGNRNLKLTVDVSPTSTQHMHDESAKSRLIYNTNARYMEIELDGTLIYGGPPKKKPNNFVDLIIDYVGGKEVIVTASKNSNEKTVTTTVTGLNTTPVIDSVVFDETERTISFRARDSNKDNMENPLNVSANYTNGKDVFPLVVSNDSGDMYKTSPIPQSDNELIANVIVFDHHNAKSTSEVQINKPTEPPLEERVIRGTMTNLSFPINPEPLLNGALFELYEGGSKVESSNVIGVLVNSVRTSHDGRYSANVNPNTYLARYSHTTNEYPHIRRINLQTDTTLDIGLLTYDETFRAFFNQIGREGNPGNGTVGWVVPPIYFVDDRPAIGSGIPIKPEQRQVVDNIINYLYKDAFRKCFNGGEPIIKYENIPTFPAPGAMIWRWSDSIPNDLVALTTIALGGSEIISALIEIPSGLGNRNLTDLETTAKHEGFHGHGLPGHSNIYPSVLNNARLPGFTGNHDVQPEDLKAANFRCVRPIRNTDPDNNLELITQLGIAQTASTHFFTVPYLLSFSLRDFLQSANSNRLNRPYIMPVHTRIIPAHTVHSISRNGFR